MELDIELKIIESDEECRQFQAWLDSTVATAARGDRVNPSRIQLVQKLLNDYECRCMAVACVDPVDAIQYRMNELGMRQKDLALLLRGKNRASEILARRRPLTLAMIRALTRSLNIPADLLILQNRNQANLSEAQTKKAPNQGA